MAAGDLNEYRVIGRLTRDPERKNFPNGGAVVVFGLATTGDSKKNKETGQWEDEPLFWDCKAFVNGEGKGPGTVIAQYCRKGTRIHLSAHLKRETWVDSQTGQNREKIVLIVDRPILLDKAESSDPTGGRPAASGRSSGRAASPPPPPPADEYGDGVDPDSIPF